MEGSSAQPPGHLSEEAEPSDGRSQCPRVELDRGPCRAVLAVAFAFYRILGKLNTHTQTHAHTQRCS